MSLSPSVPLLRHKYKHIIASPSYISYHLIPIDSILYSVSHPIKETWRSDRADSRIAPTQWETALLCNDVSHWLGANLESTLGGSHDKPPSLLFNDKQLQWKLGCIGQETCDSLTSLSVTRKYTKSKRNRLLINVNNRAINEWNDIWGHCTNVQLVTCDDSTIITHDDVIKWKHIPRYWPLCREFTGLRWIPRTKASDAELWSFLWSTPQ